MTPPSSRYEGIGEARPHLGVFEGVTSIAGCGSALDGQGVRLEPDPLEVARGNQYRFDQVVRGVREVYEAWLAKREAESASSAQAPGRVRLDATVYLRDDWPEEDLFERAKQAVDDSGFHDAVAGCGTIEAMRAP